MRAGHLKPEVGIFTWPFPKAPPSCPVLWFYCFYHLILERVHRRDQTGVPHVPTRPQPHLPLICLPRPTTPAYKQAAAYTKHNSFEKCKLDLKTKYLINLFV